MSFNNKAFTLVELLGVIIVLSVIAVIIFPIYNESIANSKENLYKEQIKSLENASRRWGVDHSSELPQEEGELCAIGFYHLIEGGYIANNTIVNPKNNQALDGCIAIYWDDYTNQYIYKYSETCMTFNDYIPTCPDTIYFDYCDLPENDDVCGGEPR